MSNVTIVSFDEEYSSIFYELNKLWIEESWLLEKSDKFDLLNPKESIIDKGGEIFFALIDGNVVGTVAMIHSADRIYELAKMTVEINYRGNGVANKLMDLESSLIKPISLLKNSNFPFYDTSHSRKVFNSMSLININSIKDYEKKNLKSNIFFMIFLDPGRPLLKSEISELLQLFKVCTQTHHNFPNRSAAKKLD